MQEPGLVQNEERCSALVMLCLVLLAKPLCRWGNAGVRGPGASGREWKGNSSQAADLPAQLLHLWPSLMELASSLGAGDDVLVHTGRVCGACLCCRAPTSTWEAASVKWSSSLHRGGRRKSTFCTFCIFQHLVLFHIYIYIQYSVNWHNYFPLVSGQELRNPVKVQ